MTDDIQPANDAAARRAERTARLSRVHSAAATIAPEQADAARTAPAGDAKEAVDISNNPIHLIMEETSLSHDEKIEKISAYLTAEKNDYPEARERFAKFEAYYAYTQSENMKIDVKGIERLAEELRNSLKPEVEKIARDLSQVQIKVQDAKKKLEVLKEARRQGKSLEELTAAFRENESLLAQISDTQKQLAALAEREKSLKADMEVAQARKRESETGFWNGAARLLGGPDKQIAVAIDSLQTRLQRAADDITRASDQKQGLEASRNQKLESGPLLILRAVDATEQGYSDDLVKAAESGISLVSGAGEAVKRLISRNAFSVEQARVINLAISRAAVTELILKKAIDHVSVSTRAQDAQLEQDLAANTEATTQKAAAGESTTNLEVQKLELEQKHHGATAYVNLLGNTAVQFDKAAANSQGAQAQAEQLNDLLQQEKDVLISMANEALPATTRALRLTLNQAVALHAHELSSTVSELTQKAQAINEDSMQQLVGTQEDIHAQEIVRLEEVTAALDAAAALMETQIDANVKSAALRMQKMEELRDAAEGLKAVGETLRATRPGVASSNAAETPLPPGSAA